MRITSLCFVAVLAAMARADQVPDFTKDVAPILNRYCVGCHTSGEPEGELVLDSYAELLQGGENGAAVKPRDSQASLLIARVTGRIEPLMPPEDEAKPSQEEIATLIRWVDGGANGPKDDAPPRQLATPILPPSHAEPPVTAVAFSPRGQVLAVGRFGEVTLLDARTGQVEAKLSGLPGKVNSIGFREDGAVLVAASGIAGLYGQVTLWDTNTQRSLKEFTGHSDAVYAAKLNGDGSLLATASYDRQIILWDVASGEQLRVLQGHNGAVYDLAFSPDARVLASASADATVKIWHVDTGRRLDTLSQPLGEQNSVDISPDGQFVVAGGADNRIRMWRLESLEEPRINPLVYARFAHEDAIQQVRFSPDGRHVISTAADNSFKVWSADRLQQVHSYQTQSDSTQALSISSDSQQIAVGRMDGSLDFYALKSDGADRSQLANAAFAVVHHAEISREPDEIVEQEPNDRPDNAMRISAPSTVEGVIGNSGFAPQSDEDVFAFAARAGETWILETKAARDGSPLDSHIAVLYSDGRPVPRVQLRAVRDSYFTFRGKDSNTTGDFRLHNWEEMKLNQFLYASGEVVKLFHYPRGPDSGFNVYPNFGNRRGYFDTTPIAHALHEPCYIVEPFPVGIELPANGLPTFVLNYENDDESQRRHGKDSQLTFIAPTDGDYLISVRDVRGLEGSEFRYQLSLRAPRPDFRAQVIGKDLTVSPGTGQKFGVEIERIDGFDGPVEVEVLGLPSGFSVAGPLRVEADHDRAWGTVLAAEDAQEPEAVSLGEAKLIASAMIEGQRVEHEVGSLGKIELGEAPQLVVRLVPDREASAGGVDLPVIEIRPGETTTATIQVDRRGYDGRINFGKEDAAINSPHGVYVANSGLNGVLIVEGHSKRQFFLTAEPWVPPMERLIFVEAEEAGKPTSSAVILRVLPGSSHANQQKLREQG